MRRYKRLLGPRIEQKAWSQPPFWSDAAALNALGNGITNDREIPENDVSAYIQKVYKDNGVVYACIQTRMLVLSEARFVWQQLRNGRGGDLFSSPELDALNSSTRMISQMEVDASLAGNAYVTWCDYAGVYGNAADKATRYPCRLAPERVEIIIHAPSGDPWGIDARVVAYLYRPWLGSNATASGVILLAEEVAHYAPIPDPAARFRGMSWITPVLREIQGDREAVDHKKNFFANGATLGHVVRFPETVSKDDFEEFVNKFKATHRGFGHAYETLFLGGGADVSTVGTDLRQLDFSATVGHAETRIAAASGVPPVIVGLSEGLQAATYSNYGQARRRFADGTLHPLWRTMAGALSTIMPPPPRARLWFDDRDIPFLREDKADQAEIDRIYSVTLQGYVNAGFVPETAVAALAASDPTLLKHTGLFSVQLQPPGAMAPAPTDPNAPPVDPNAPAPKAPAKTPVPPDGGKPNGK